MRPEVYEDYSRVFDYFAGNPVYQQLLVYLTAKELRPGDPVTDVGAGSGNCSAALLRRIPDLKLTLVDPSPSMLRLARSKLPDSCVLCQATIDEALVELPPQKAFVLARTLYGLYRERHLYTDLFSRLHARLLAGGCLSLIDFNGVPRGLLEIEGVRDCESNRRLAARDPQLFEQNWSCFRSVLEQFGQDAEAGLYTFWTLEELSEVMREVGFSTVFGQTAGERMVAIFRKDEG